jgi:hypothetical protein
VATDLTTEKLPVFLQQLDNQKALLRIEIMKINHKKKEDKFIVGSTKLYLQVMKRAFLGLTAPSALKIMKMIIKSTTMKNGFKDNDSNGPCPDQCQGSSSYTGLPYGSAAY